MLAMAMLDVLVCIITFKRVAQLERLLDALCAQQLRGFAAGILVVDNDPAGSGRAACERFFGQQRLPLRHVVEPESGIVAARNRAAREFLAGDAAFLAFIDDDEWPAEDDWLQNMLHCARTHAADIVAADVVSVGETGVPGWATEILYRPSGQPEGTAVGVFYTGNVLVARRVFERLAPPFDSRFALSGASDYHFALKCRRAGFRAVHADAPVVEEFPRDRATVGWFVRRGFRSGAGYTRSHLIEEPLLTAVARAAATSLARAAVGLLAVLKGVVLRDKAQRVKGLFRLSAAAGTLAGLGGLTYNEYRGLHE